MKRFLSYSLLFALIVGLSLAIGEILCRTYANPYDYKDRWLSKHASEVETLILGSSVNYYGIDPSLLDGNTFNLAGVSQNPEYDYRLLRHYFDHIDHAPRRVLLSVSYTTLTDPPLEQSREWMHAQGYRIYMGINRNPWLSRYGFEICNLNGYAGKLRNMLSGQNSIICDTLGHGTAMSHDTRHPNWRDEISLTVSRHTAPDFSHAAYNLAYLDSIVNWCDARGVQPILITTPRHHIYRDAMPVRQKEMTWTLIDSIASARHIQWIDLSDDPEFTDDDFFDGDHLSSDSGATHLTLRLRTLLPPL